MSLLVDAYFRQFQDLSKNIQAQLARPLDEALQRLLDSAVLAFEELPSRVTAEIGEAFEQLVAASFDKLEQSFEALSPRARQALITLGEHGWYLDLEMSMPDLWELEQALMDGDVTQAERWLCDYFAGRLEEIETSITARFPDRAHLIKSAFAAHRKEEYALSIPVLLAQTDGICRQAIGGYLFMKKDKKPRTAAYVEQLAADSFLAAILSPLAQTLPINASEAELPEGSEALNRHEVVHGMSLDYGTEVNGLKAISLINYVANVATDGGEENT